MFPKVITQDGEVWAIEDDEPVERIVEMYGSSTADMDSESLARRIAALWNATRHLTIEQLESDDPLGREDTCREQREACTKALECLAETYGVNGPASERYAQEVLGTPTPLVREGQDKTS